MADLCRTDKPSSNSNLIICFSDILMCLLVVFLRNQCQVMELLLKKGAGIDALNNGECSTLHVAVNKQHLDCVRVLLLHKANVNIQVCFC